MATIDDICVDIRDNSFVRIARVPNYDLVGFQLVKRFNNVGYWEVTISNSSPIVSYLREPGNGIVVQLYGQIIFSGNVTSVTRVQSQEDPDGVWRITGSDDNQYLQDYLCWPAAPIDDVTNQDQSWYLRSGIISTLMYDLVNVNIGDLAGVNRALTQLSLAEDPVIGGEGYLSTKWDTIGHALSRLAYMATPHLRYEILQDDETNLVFSIAAVADHTDEYRFDIFNNQILRNEWTYTAPEATIAIVGGLSDGIDRIYREATTDGSTDAQNEWSRRIETFVDNKSDFDSAVLIAQGQAALQENGATKHGFSIVPNEDVPFYRFGTHFNLGDTVTVTIETNDVLQTITEYALSIQADGIRQTLGIGNVEVLQNISGDAPQMTIVGRYAAKTQKLQSRIKALEQSISNVNADAPTIGPGITAARGDGQYFWAINATNYPIERGEVVYIVGLYGDYPMIEPFDTLVTPPFVYDTIYQMDGMTTEYMDVGEGNWVCVRGKVTGLDLSDWDTGWPIYYGFGGWWEYDPFAIPRYPYVQIGTVLDFDSENGSLFFNPLYNVTKKRWKFEGTIFGTQSIPSTASSYTIVGNSATANQQWDWVDTSNEEVFTMGETSTTRGQLTVNISGLYDVYAQVRWGSNATGKRNLRISKNLGNDPDIVAVAEQAVDTTRQFVSRSRVWLETGDILTMEVLQTSGSSQSLAPTTTAPIYMHIEYLGDEEF